MAISSTDAQTRTVASGHALLNRLLFGLAVLPMMVIAAIINHYGVNVPYGDEWKFFSFFEKWDSNRLTFADFYSAHNGHRIVIPRLIYLAVIQLTHGNLRTEMFFSLFLCILTSAGIYLLLRRTVNGSTTKHLALWALMNLFLFSPIQAENWLWGFQLQVFLSNLCIVGAIVCITSEAGILVRFATALAFALAGTFSFGNGLVIWPCLFIVLLCRREKIAVQVAWITAGVLVLLAYIPGYPTREPVPPTTQWFDYLLYFAGFLGAPLARIPNSKPLVLPVILGIILLAGYVWNAARLVRHRERLRNTAPWLALGAYVIASAVMASGARVHSGPFHALDSRYTTVSVVLVVSLIGLVAAAIHQSGKAVASGLRKRSVIARVAIGGLLILYVINIPFELRYLRLNHSFRARGKGALEFSSVLALDEMVRSTLLIREDPGALTRYLGMLDRLELIDPPRRKTLVLSDAEDRPKRSTNEYGVFEDLKLEGPGTLVASGWSYLPADGRPPAGVLLAYRSGHEWKAFAFSGVTERRPDLVTKHKSRSYLERGWRQSFAWAILPAGGQEISAWALDAKRGATYRLPGSFQLQR